MGIGRGKIRFMAREDDFSEVYRKYSDKIFRYLYWQTKNFHLSEDLTSEVFTRAWETWESLRKDFLQAWLFRVAHNLLVDWYRKKKEVSLNESRIGFYDENLLEKLGNDEQVKELSEALDTLPENLKRVAILRFIEGLSAKEAAVILSVSEVNVRVLQHRALVKLKEVMNNAK